MSYFLYFIMALVFIRVCRVRGDILAKNVSGEYTRGLYRSLYASDDTKGYLKNPERGFRLENAVILDENLTDPFTGAAQSGDKLKLFYQQEINGGSYQIAQQFIYLNNYLTKNLDDKAFIALTEIFEQAKSAGVKLLVRFAYKLHAKQTKSEPDIHQLKRHMYQLKPFMANEVIYAFQFGWIGTMGEQEQTSYSRVQQKEIYKTFFTECLPPNRKVTIRYKNKRDMFITSLEPLYAEDRFRIGFHNNYYLLDTHPQQKYNAFILNNLALNDLKDMGGNTIYDVEMPDNCENDTYCLNFVPVDFGIGTIARFSELGPTTMSVSHKLELIIENLRETVLLPISFKYSGIFCDKNYFFDDAKNRFVERTAFEYIRDHLGYRLTLEEAVYPNSISVNSMVNVQFTLRNYGFSKPVNSRPVAVVLLDDKDRAIWVHFSNIGVETCVPIRSCYFNIDFFLPNIKTGDYFIALWMPDESVLLRNSPMYDIKLANSGTSFKSVETTEHRFNVFGSLKVVK